MEHDYLKQLTNLLLSPFLWAALSAYIIGQFSKLLFIKKGKDKKFTLRELFQSGRMPSTHTASTCALTTVVGLSTGFDSVVFAVSVMLTLVVAYDACHVRRAVGEQGLVLRSLIDRGHMQEDLLAQLAEETNDKHKLTKPYFSRGHLPKEVVAGAFLGVVIGLIVAMIFKVI